MTATKAKAKAKAWTKTKVSARARKPVRTTLARRGPVTPAKRVDIVRLPTGADPKQHIVVDRQLQALSFQLAQLTFDFTSLAEKVLADKLYERLHYQDPDEYFESRIGFSWRSLRRRLATNEAIRRLDGEEQAECRAALAGVGVHRAAVLAPVIGVKGQDWRKWVQRAKRLDEDALQGEVSKALGLKKRGAAANADLTPDERWWKRTLALVPEDARGEVDTVFDMGLVLLDQPDKIPHLQVLMSLARECRVEWEHQATEKGWKPKVEVGD